MRVLLINVNYGDSSTGKIVQDLHHSLLARGNEAAVCYGRGKDRTDSDRHIYKFGLDWETYLHAGLTRVTGYTGCFSPLSTRRLIRNIDEFQPDIIHLHELHAYFVSLAPLLQHISLLRIPVVWTFHCEFMYTGKCGYAYECDRWLRSCGSCPHLRDYVSTLWFDHTAQMLAEKRELLDGLDLRVVCPSEWLADRVRRSFLGSRSISVVHNGVDTSIFHPCDTSGLRSELGIGVDKKVVLAVAPNLMDERKGGRWILELAKLNESKNVQFVMVGVDEGTEPIDAGRNVTVIGPIWDKSILAKYYSMADAFVICSKRETYSMTCAEAISCGTSVIGFECGAPETVFDTEVATFVRYGDVAALDATLNSVLLKERANQQIGSYSSSLMCKRYIELYENCMKS